MKKPVILLGAGGHAKVVLSLLRALKWPVIGLVDPHLAEQDIQQWRGVPVLGHDDAVLKNTPDEVLLANGIGSLPGQWLRQQLYENFKQQGYTFATLIHPSALIAEGVHLESGVQIMAGCIVQPDVHIGCNSIINTGARIDHDCSIGDHCHIAPGALLSGHVSVGHSSHLGPGAVLIQGCSLGCKAIIGAGTTVLGDVPANSKVLGAKSQPLFTID